MGRSRKQKVSGGHKLVRAHQQANVTVLTEIGFLDDVFLH
jgi:hypothetical protein